MRLRNRITKADFWTDGELLRWPRDKRFFYKSLWAMAEDSCCIEDDPFSWKCSAWSSPMDSDMTFEQMESWRDELIAAKKLVPYGDNGKRYLYIPQMAHHEKPRNPQNPSNPLPPWVKWVVHSSDVRKGRYEHSPPESGASTCDDVVLDLNEDSTTNQTDTLTVPALPCPVPSRPEPPSVQPNWPGCFRESDSEKVKGAAISNGAATKQIERLAQTVNDCCPSDCNHIHAGCIVPAVLDRLARFKSVDAAIRAIEGDARSGKLL